jgi:hypothetical protein
MSFAFSYRVADGVDRDLPGIYIVTIGALIVYVGKYLNWKRPFRAYARNVRRHQLGLPYRLGKPGDWRQVHLELSDAVRRGEEVAITIVENVIDPVKQRLPATGFDVPGTAPTRWSNGIGCDAEAARSVRVTVLT